MTVEVFQLTLVSMKWIRIGKKLELSSYEKKLCSVSYLAPFILRKLKPTLEIRRISILVKYLIGRFTYKSHNMNPNQAMKSTSTGILCHLREGTD